MIKLYEIFFSVYGYSNAFEPIAQWILALNKELASGTLKDVELGECKLKLLLYFHIHDPALAVCR